eukprot:TRINITY_DN9567_c0_g2_i1.p1 TRINITY_DN9567_c0_g2~~TRINITY_DN9567_c0_g2_i1.p1  ORF type:complete len:367 (-),score=48.55 TRINITY_DN9567_c0_g2_i1:211-1311(-)
MDNPGGTIVWIDSDPYVKASILKNHGFNVVLFNEVKPAMDYLREKWVVQKKMIDCVITSSMKSGGRQEKGLPNGLQLVDFVRKTFLGSHKPLLAFITASADRQEVLEAGFTIYVQYDRNALQQEVVSLLKSSPNRDFRKNYLAGANCGWDSRDFARAIAEHLTQNTFCDFHSAYSDLCFCSKCEPVRMQTRAGSKYALPIGWFGFGICLREDFLDRRSEIEKWHVAYHGTKSSVIWSVLNERRIMFPGDTLKDGTVLRMAHGNCGTQKPSIYLSPTIFYASHPVYAEPFDFKGKHVQVALQCRVKPGSYTKYRETLGNQLGIMTHIDPEVRKNGTYDPEFPLNEVEWIVSDREGVVPYRLLLKWWD